MKDDRFAEVRSAFPDDAALLSDLEELWAQIDVLWDRDQSEPAYGGYVSANYEAVFQTLAELRGTAVTFLEWGSGLGLVTIMASRLGFEAYGIESEPELVEHAEQFAATYAPDATFVHGSFIPDEYEWNPAGGDDAFRTNVDAVPGYDRLGMSLQDFDIVYAYPWPDEHALYHNIMRECGRPGSLFVSYDAREGMDVIRFGQA